MDVTFHNMAVEDYNLTIVSLFYPFIKINLNNQRILELHAGVGPRYSLSLSYAICSIQGHKQFTLGKLIQNMIIIDYST